jgi:hypothetical protein
MSTAAKYPPRDSSARPVAPVDGLGIVAGVAQHVAQAFLEKVGAGGTPVAGEYLRREAGGGARPIFTLGRSMFRHV